MPVLVVLGCGVQVVVVVVQPRLFERQRLVRFKHAQRGAGLQAQPFDGANQRGHFIDVAVFGGPPGGAHAKPCGTRILGRLGSAQHFVHLQQLLRLHAGVKLGRLGAVAAVFGAPTCFDR